MNRIEAAETLNGISMLQAGTGIMPEDNQTAYHDRLRRVRAGMPAVEPQKPVVSADQSLDEMRARLAKFGIQMEVQHKKPDAVTPDEVQQQ